MAEDTQYYPAFAVTIRPKGGVNTDWKDCLMKVLNKSAKNWKVVQEQVEGPGTEHYHLGVVFNKAMSLSNATQRFRRAFKDLIESSGSNKFTAIKVKRWFQGTGWDEYMEKDGEEAFTIATNIDGDIKDMLWPHVPEAERKRKVNWAEMVHYEKLWEDERDVKPVKPEDCVQFLNEMAYAKRKLALPKTGKELRCKAVHLYRFINKYRGGKCIDDEVDEMRHGISGPAMAPGFGC